MGRGCSMSAFTASMAAIWSLVWVGVSFVFMGWMWWYLGGTGTDEAARTLANEKSLEFLTGYLIEKALAVDNIFVFLMLFTYFAVQLRIKLSLDDSLDVWGVHGVGGTWGAFATGIFAVAAVGGGAGLIDDNAGQLARQLTGISAVWVYSFVLTAAILLLLDRVMGLRVTEEEERLGLDASQHGERGYVFDEASAVPAASPASPPPPPPTPPAPPSESAASEGS